MWKEVDNTEDEPIVEYNKEVELLYKPALTSNEKTSTKEPRLSFKDFGLASFRKFNPLGQRSSAVVTIKGNNASHTVPNGERALRNSSYERKSGESILWQTSSQQIDEIDLNQKR